MLIELDALEIHSGIVAGPARMALPVLPPVPGAPIEVIEALLLEAMERQPVHVSFSGGRDSSLMLAAAVRVARRHGLPDPIPLTATYPDHPETFEDEWQQSVLDHLGVGGWRRLEVTDELDVLGDLATSALLEHGVYWPSVGHSMSLIARAAGGGTLVTGGGGDEVFMPWPWRRWSMGEVAALRPRRRALKWGVFFQLPLRSRQRILPRIRDDSVHLPWLTTAAEQQLNERLNLPPAAAWPDDLERYVGGRYRECIRVLLTTLAAREGVRLLEPLYDPRVIRSVGAAGPVGGFRDRSSAMTALFADLLPEAILTRVSKASFSGPGWGERARAFARSWDGRGIDPDLADAERLHAEWLSPVPDARSVTALHHVWLESVSTR